MRVLLVTDLSEAGLGAVHGLIACGSSGFDTITLLHVIDVNLYTAGGSVPQLQEWAEVELAKAAADLKESGFETATRVEVGPVLESVNKVAEETAAELVVTTNLGRGAVAGRLLGSVAERLPLATKLPVLIERVGHDGERWCRMGGESPFARVVAGVDLSDEAASMIGQLLRLPGAGSVRLVHVVSNEEARSEAEALLKSLAADLETDIEIDTSVRVGDPGEQLLAEADDAGATMLAVTAHSRGMLHRGVLGSVARKVTTESDRAVLLLPASVD